MYYLIMDLQDLIVRSIMECERLLLTQVDANEVASSMMRGKPKEITMSVGHMLFTNNKDLSMIWDLQSSLYEALHERSRFLSIKRAGQIWDKLIESIPLETDVIVYGDYKLIRAYHVSTEEVPGELVTPLSPPQEGKTERMNPYIKALWVNALLSGDYEQGQQVLRRYVNGTDVYCCLGVLCQITYPHDWGQTWDGHEVRHIESYTYPSDRVIATAGLNQSNPVLHLSREEFDKYEQMYDVHETYEGGLTLARLNDMGVSHAEIAQLIIKYL